MKVSWITAFFGGAVLYVLRKGQWHPCLTLPHSVNPCNTKVAIQMVSVLRQDHSFIVIIVHTRRVRPPVDSPSCFCYVKYALPMSSITYCSWRMGGYI